MNGVAGLAGWRWIFILEVNLFFFLASAVLYISLGNSHRFYLMLCRYCAAGKHQDRYIPYGGRKGVRL